MSDTLTLVLDGPVTLDVFARAVAEFRGLVGALSEEVAPDVAVEWGISDLVASSAIMTTRGVARGDAVRRIVSAYEAVGAALEKSEQIPYSQRVQRHAQSISALVHSPIESIRFETQERDAVIRRPFVAPVVPKPVVASVPPVKRASIGTVEGLVETLSSRGGLRFTLYDTMYNKAVSCYLKPGYEEIMRKLWGKRAVVLGNVTRDPETGRPLSVRQVTSADEVHERQPGDWRRARGALGQSLPTRPEQIIRAARDA